METNHIAWGLIEASASLRQHVSQFATWWSGELLALVPSSLRQALTRGAHGLIVHVDGSEANFTVSGPQGLDDIAELDLGSGVVEQRQVIDSIKKACGDQVDEVTVRIPVHHALHRTLMLPLAAEENLREVLAFEMDRHTPFNAAQVYYDFTIVTREPAKRSLQLELTLIPRSKVDPLLDTLAKWGLKPTSLDITAGRAPDGDAWETAGLNLLPADRNKTRRGNANWYKRALAALAAVLLVTAVALPFVQKVNVLMQLEAKVEEAREKAVKADELRKELEQLVAQANILVSKRKERPNIIQVVDELTRILPDSTWLNRLEVSERSVKMQGESFNTSEVATLIEVSTLLADASFDAPVTRNPRTETERFVISAKIKHTNE